MTVTVALAGDTMLGRGVARALATTPPEALVAPEVRAALGEADLVVLNLECCISERGRPWNAPGKPFFFRAPPQAVELLVLLGTDCVTLPTTTPWTTASLRQTGWFSPTPWRRSPTRTRGCLAGRRRLSCGASRSSARASLRRRHPRAGARPAQDHPLTRSSNLHTFLASNQAARRRLQPPVPMRGSSGRRVRHGALSGRRGRFATRSGR
jgi:hypothetical protein